MNRSLHYRQFTGVFSLVLLTLSARGDTVALLVGNNDYQFVGKLRNPIRDVNGIGNKFKGAGVRHEIVADATRTDMEEALDRLRLASMKASVVMFYFAGHGIEIEGKNYLLPTDVKRPASSSGVATGAISLDQVLERLGQCGMSSRVLVLDCCRNNPFGNQPGGLARIKASSLPPDTVVMYSGAPGEAVSDGGVGGHSPFAKRVIENLVPGKSALTIFSTVATTIDARQKPWIKFDGEGEKFARLVLSPLMGQKLPEGVNLRLLANFISVYQKDDPLERRGYSRPIIEEGIGHQIKLIQSIAEVYFPADYFGSIGVLAYLEREMKTVAEARRSELKEQGENHPNFLSQEAAEAKFSELSQIWNEMARLVASRSLEGNALEEWLKVNNVEADR